MLLLDEATANLDLATEARVQQAMGLLARDRTTLLIAHRLDTARRADRLVVMAGGRVVEVGSHEQLLVRRGIYAELWHAGQGSSQDGLDDRSELGDTDPVSAAAR